MDPETPAAETASPTPTVTAAPAAATPTPTPAPTPAPEPATGRVELTPAEYQALLAERAENRRAIEAEAARRAEAEKRAMERAVEAGDVKKVLETLTVKSEQEATRLRQEFESTKKAIEEQSAAATRRLAEEKTRLELERNAIEARAKKFALDGELGRALASHNLVEGAAEDLTALLRGQFLVEPDGDSFAVRSQSGQAVSEFVRGYLERKPHYLRSASARGGTIGAGTTAAAQPAAQVDIPPPAPEVNLGNAVLDWMKSRAPRTGDAASDPSLPIGLRRVAR